VFNKCCAEKQVNISSSTLRFLSSFVGRRGAENRLVYNLCKANILQSGANNANFNFIAFIAFPHQDPSRAKRKLEKVKSVSGNPDGGGGGVG
jgi:hypothetical protein